MAFNVPIIDHKESYVEVKAPIDPELEANEKTVLCQFGSKTTFKGRFLSNVPVTILDQNGRVGSRKIYFVETTTAINGVKMIGRAFVPDKEMKAFMEPGNRLYCPRFYEYVDYPKNQLEMRREDALRRLQAGM